MKSFITEYLDFTKELESPGSFFTWSALSCVAAALRDNVWLHLGPGYLYPNIYVLLIASSGMHRKAMGIRTVSTLLREVQNTKIIAGRSSIQAVIETLSGTQTDKKSGSQILGGSCLLSVEELAAFFVEDPSAMNILTDIYDCREHYEYNLRGGKLIIKNLCVSMLAASNEELLRDVWKKREVYGGLMGRTFFVKPDETRNPNTLLIDITEEPYNGHYDLNRLLSPLREITKLKGQMSVTPEAKRIYKTWYEDMYHKYQSKPDKTGVLARIHTGVLKLAMCLAAGHRYELVIDKDEITQAIDYCISIIPNYEVFTMSSGKALDSEVGAILMAELFDPKNNNSISRKVFIRNHWTELDEDKFNALLNKLQTAGLIKVDFSSMDVTDAEIKLTELGQTVMTEAKKKRQDNKQ